MPFIALINQCCDNPMPCLASFFDAMSGVKKLTNFSAAINCKSSADEPSNGALAVTFAS